MKIDDDVLKIVLVLVFGWMIYHLYTNMCSCQIEGMIGLNIDLGVGQMLNLPRLGIDKLTLRKSSSPLFPYEINFVNKKPGKFVFMDNSGESYTIVARSKGKQQIQFDSSGGAPRIVHASLE